MASGRGAEALEELRIRFRQVGVDRYLVLANGPASAADVIDWRHRASFAEQLDELFKEAFGEETRISAKPIDVRLTELGRELFGALFPATIRDCLEASIGIAQAEDCKLRLRFDLPAALSDLPVEILCPPPGDPIGLPFALNGSLSVVRSVASRENPRLPKPEDNEQPLSILVVAASPRGRELLDVTEEIRLLRDRLRRFTGADRVVLDVLGGEPKNDPPTLDELTNKVVESDNPLAVLLIAHGEISADRAQARVVLESDDGSAQPIDANDLAVIFANAPQVRFVALNLCVGARVVGREPLSGVAQAIISNGVPAVVGMSTDVSDQAVSRFSAPLFCALSDNGTIDKAVQSARIHMKNSQADTRIEWCAPVLCVGGGFPRGHLFKVRPLEGERIADFDRIDPIREGLEARIRLQGSASPHDLALVAFFARATGRWEEVRDRATAGIRAVKGEQRKAPFRRLINEACIELAMNEIDGLCVALANEPTSAQLALPALRGVPKPIVDRLKMEIAQAVERRQLHERYTKGLEAATENDWATVVAQFKIFEERAYRDGRQWLAYATGRLAEDQGRWVDAGAAYREVGDSLPNSDVGRRWTYAQGRAAELDDEWPKAADAYAALRADYRDRDQRLPYARGRSAEQEEDWPEAVTVFGPLEDSYLDVALRRGYATARVAEGDSAWARVSEILTGLDGGFRDGDLGQLRDYAEARMAEEDDGWNRAMEIYKALGAGGRDVVIRWPYAVGRAAEAQGQWAAAAEAYQQVPDDHLDAVVRRLYVTARHAEETGDWVVAVRAYQAIPEHPHTAERLPYARACLADSTGDWKAVLGALGGAAQLAGDLEETARLLSGYARGRVAEEAGQWLGAAETYQACGQFRDAPARAQYMHGQDLDDKAEWTEALAAYEPVIDVLADARRAVDRLTQLRQALPWVDGLPRCGLADDPAVPDELTSPYQALRAVGITPSSTAQEVKDASFALMEASLWTPEVHMVWNRLCRLPERLAADALLYQLTDGPALSRAQRDLEAGPLGELLARLRSQLEPDAPLFALLSGQRETAIAEWAGRLQNDPHATGTAHALALAWTWHAIELGNAALHEDAARGWERAIAYCCRVLSDDAYWASWRSQRASFYQSAVSLADLSRARRALVDWLSERLARVADRSRRDGQIEHAERYGRLRLVLAVEMAATRVLADTGGTAGDGESPAPACGPLFVRLHPELRAPLSDLVAHLDAEEGATGACFRLRCAFSQLGEAIVLLEQNRPDRAVEALRGLHRIMLKDLPADCGHELSAGGAGCAECAEFVERNPGYAGLPHRRTRLLQDAVDLATRAFLAQAQTALVDSRTGVDTALQHWREAIEVAANVGASVRIKQSIIPVALGRADVLKDEHWGTRLTDERLTEAIGLVAAARRLVGNVDAGQLTAKEAELLTVRGVWRGCWCYEYDEPSYPRGIDDLRQALILNSESLDTRDNLTHGLTYWAESLHHQSSAGQQLRLLGEALTVVHEGLLRTPGYVLFRMALAKVLDELEQWCFDELTDEELDRRLRERSAVPVADRSSKAEQLIRKAESELERHPVAGVLSLIAAVRSDVGPEIRQRLVDALTQVSNRAEWSE
jgi:hypothetical protein